MGIGGGVLAYLHMIFPVLPAHLLGDFAKQWALSGMEGQCHRVRRYPSSSALISQSSVLQETSHFAQNINVKPPNYHVEMESKSTLNYFK